MNFPSTCIPKGAPAVYIYVCMYAAICINICSTQVKGWGGVWQMLLRWSLLDFPKKIRSRHFHGYILPFFLVTFFAILDFTRRHIHETTELKISGHWGGGDASCRKKPSEHRGIPENVWGIFSFCYLISGMLPQYKFRNYPKNRILAAPTPLTAIC